MTDSKRPTVAPGVLGEILASAPARLQRKLDKNPQAAEDWDWQNQDNEVVVDTGSETVTLKADGIQTVDDVACTCLLSPRCFHVVATLILLEIADAGEESEAAVEPEVIEDDEENRLTNKQARAAKEMFTVLGTILAGGLRAAGTSQQSRLLRVVHECRSHGLHRLAASGLRVLQHIRQLRIDSHATDEVASEFESDVAVADLGDALEVAWRLCQLEENAALPAPIVGTARRRYTPFTSMKLHGLFSEPILTNSGYAGAVTYLISEDGWMASVSDVQPGDASRLRQAWKSGVDVAGMSISNRELSRSALLISQATRSADGRIGGGQSARAVAVKTDGWSCDAIQKRFEESLTAQIEKCFTLQTLPFEQRPAGSDLVFITAEIMGYMGHRLIARDINSDHSLQFSIPIDHEDVPFRENFCLLARAPGQFWQCIGRVQMNQPSAVSLLALSPHSIGGEHSFSLPDGMSFHIDLGFDELSRSHFTKAERSPVQLPVQAATNTVSDDVLFRWLRAIAIGGRHAVPSGKVNAMVRDARHLAKQLRPTASALLTNLAETAVSTSTDLRGLRFPANSESLAQHWLAAEFAYRSSKRHLAQKMWA